MLATFAFDVCHDVYRAAREVIDTKIPTLNLESSGKYLWHPDRMPRLAEYVADFARAGERALGEDQREERRRMGLRDARCAEAYPSNGLRASRMAMFRVYYLGGAEYQAARRHLGNQRADLGGLGGGNSHARRAGTGELGRVSAVEIFSGNDGAGVVNDGAALTRQRLLRLRSWHVAGRAYGDVETSARTAGAHSFAGKWVRLFHLQGT